MKWLLSVLCFIFFVEWLFLNLVVLIKGIESKWLKYLLKKINITENLTNYGIVISFLGLNSCSMWFFFYMKKNYKLKPKLSLWLKEKITANKNWATQQKLTRNESTWRQCIKLRCGPIDAWHECQEPGPPVKVYKESKGPKHRYREKHRKDTENKRSRNTKETKQTTQYSTGRLGVIGTWRSHANLRQPLSSRGRRDLPKTAENRGGGRLEGGAWPLRTGKWDLLDGACMPRSIEGWFGRITANVGRGGRRRRTCWRGACRVKTGGKA